MPWAWRCPNATLNDRHHVLRLVGSGPLDPPSEGNPFIWGAAGSAWAAFARANGMTAAACEALADEVDHLVSAVDGHGFQVTPCSSVTLPGDLGSICVKDETANVSGSHKGRHLMSILLHLRAAELLRIAPVVPRPRLAIASCGNAALAAATLAAAVEWPIDVFVPSSASAVVLTRLSDLGATVIECPRRLDDPPGDPCVRRFRGSVNLGSIPFSVQGPENAYCLDGGRTIGWELAAQTRGLGIAAVYVQVGGGALATGIGDGMREVLGGAAPALIAVQTAGCAPLARAWDEARAWPVGVIGRHWSECMWPWETEPVSAAGGILDDESYDWIGVVEAMAATSGGVVVADEAQIEAANHMLRSLSGIDVDHTGSAGFAGYLAHRASAGDARVAGPALVIASGRRRT